jgi:cytochrome c oxidase cbb3-type subunit 3
MFSDCRNRPASLCLALLLSAAGGCQREHRELQRPPADSAPPAQLSVSPLVGGQTDFALRARQQKDFGDNAYQISQGKTLYGAFNCYGCHAWGGGDIGPPLMDEKWIYGSEIDQVYQSIAQGRANGMPAFAGRISSEQIWQLAAFVRSMSGHAPAAARPARDEHLRTPAPLDAEPGTPSSTERED